MMAASEESVNFVQEMRWFECNLSNLTKSHDKYTNFKFFSGHYFIY
jgi:hypothetical protein